MAAFAEVTRIGHGHGGTGWELGRCLWHQAKTKSGQDRNAAMREPRVDDEIFHLVAGLDPARPRRRFLWGVSRVAEPFRVVDSPPDPGDWPGRGEYYRIELKDTARVEPPYPLQEIAERERDLIMTEIGEDRVKYYLYCPRGDGFQITQGIYVTRLSSGLADAFREVVAGQKIRIAPSDRRTTRK